MEAVIPAAGLGTRMASVMKGASKELYNIGDEVVLGVVIKGLYDIGVNKMFIVLNYEKKDIVKYVDNINMPGLKVEPVEQKERLGLAHALYQADGFVKEDYFIGAVADAVPWPLTEYNKVLNIDKNSFANILIREVEDPTIYGVVKTKGNKLIDCFEKPSWEQAEKYKSEDGEYLVNLAIYYLKNKKFFEYFEKTSRGRNNEYQVPDLFLTALHEGENINVSKIDGEYWDIGNPKGAMKVRERYAKLLKQGVVS